MVQKKVVFCSLLLAVLYYTGSLAQSTQELMKSAQEETDIVELERIYIQLTNYYLTKDLDSMYIFASEFLDIAKQHNNRRILLGAHYNLGRYHAVKGESIPAIEHFQEAYALSDTSIDATMKGRILGMIGYVYNGDEQLETALEYFQQTIPYFESDGALGPLSITYSTIGSVYYKQDNLDEAKKYYKRSLRIKETLNDSLRMTTDINNLARIFRETGQLDSAVTYLDRSLAINLATGATNKLIGSYRDLAQLQIRLGNGELALEYALKTVEYAEEYNSFADLERAYEVLYDAYNFLGDSEKALENYIIAHTYKDSIINEASRQALIEAQEKFEAEKREQEIVLLASRTELQRTRIILVSVLLGTGLFIAISIAIRVAYVKRKELEISEIDRKLANSERKLAEEELKNEKLRFEQVQKELTDYALHIVEKNDFLEQLKEQIYGIRFGSDRDEMRRQLTKMEMKILQNVTINEQREELQSKVSQVCSGFFSNLESNYPELSEKDKRLAALIRLKLSAKEIAGILNIEPKSVEQSRYRLRKKLSLSPDQDLLKILLEM